jgi:cyclic lactone autoinducer peptide
VNFIANILAAIGAGAANAGTQGCIVWLVDEPKMPKCLIEK